MPLRIFAGLALLLAQAAFALPQAVLSNLDQPSQGAYDPISVQDWVAIPFVTDGSFTEFQAVELSAATLFPPGLFFVEIWDTDAFGQPNAVVQVLSGPSAPDGVGLAQYVGPVSLTPMTSYFVVIGTRNGGSQTALFTKDNNQADSMPTPIYQLGTDIDNDGTADVFNRCLGTVGPQLTVSWSCGGPITRVFFPKFRILAEQPAPPPSFSLTASPTALDFGTVPDGSSSAVEAVSIINDGTAEQILGTLTISDRFSIVTDGCSGMTLAPTESCPVTLQFTPDHGGATAGTLLIPATTDPVPLYGLPLTGQSDGAQIELPRPGQPIMAIPIPTLPLGGLILMALSLLWIGARQFRA